MSGKNLVYVSNSVIPSRTANSIHVMKMCEAFSNAGYNVTLIVPDRSHEYEQKISDVFSFYGVSKSFKVVKTGWTYARFGWALFAINATWKLVRHFRGSIVYTRFMPLSILLATIRFPSIFEAHAPLWTPENYKWKLFFRLVGRQGIAGIVVISHALKEFYVGMGIPENRIFVSHDAASVDYSGNGIQKLHGRIGALQVGYVGSLYEGKGIEVIQMLAEAYPGGDFHIIGGRQKELFEWKNRIKSENVYFHGFVPHSEVARYIKALDVCLLPNQNVVRVYSSSESKSRDIGKYTSPLKMFEYMAHGKAIVASNIPVLREVLDTTISILAGPNDVAGWAEALKQFEDKNTRAHFGERAREVFLSQYTWERRAEVVSGFIVQMMSVPRG